MKKMNKKGFTLAELLIVVAIIAVLVAVAIPVFNTQLEKARQGTDLANLRSSYAEAVANYLTSDESTQSASVAGATYKMQNKNGNLALVDTDALADNFNLDGTTSVFGNACAIAYTDDSGSMQVDISCAE